MRVTGVITCRNYSEYVGRSIRSFYDQEFEPKRLVVFDDASEDDSWRVISGAVGEHPPCPTRLLRSDDVRGVASARNACVAHAWEETDVFAFLDADDEYLPGKVVESVKMLDTGYGRIGMVYSDEAVHDAGFGPVRVNFKPSFSLERLLSGDVVGGNMLVPRSAFAAVGRFDPTLRAGDVYNLSLRMARDHVLIHVPKTLDFTRITPSCLRRTVPQSEWGRGKQNAAT